VTAAVVGVSCYTPRGSDGKNFSLPFEYISSLQRAGLGAIILPTDASIAVLERIDGLVLAGGGDLEPASYGGQTHATNYMMDGERDAFELRLLDRALTAGLPVLAICRGMQILNVAFGGDLHAHIPERYGGRIAHRLPPREPVQHDVSVREGSRLAGAVGALRIQVMSWHHQAVDSVGEGLEVVAHADDGVIEALEFDDSAWVVGVQWHPELDADENRHQAALFEEFAAKVGQARSSR